MSVFGSPPFSITPAIQSLVSDIVAALLPYSWQENTTRSAAHHDRNGIRKIHASLAMEHFSRSVEDVADLLAGHRIAFSPQEMREVKNTAIVYHSLPTYDASSVHDFCTAHDCLMQGLMMDAGQYRRSGSGLARGRRMLYLAPPADHVPSLMLALFGWLARANIHPLILGCVFHCELEFIHPFSDGNGRMGRLWQTLIHSRWSPVLANLPWEAELLTQQETFYEILADCDSVGNSTAGIEFLLHTVWQALRKESEEPSRINLIHYQERMH